MSKLVDDHHPIDLKIASELIAATPEHWVSAALRLTRIFFDGEERVQLYIFNEEGQLDLITPTDDLYELSFQLADVFKKHGANWREITYRVTQGRDEEWDWKADYKYFGQ